MDMVELLVSEYRPDLLVSNLLDFGGSSMWSACLYFSTTLAS